MSTHDGLVNVRSANSFGVTLERLRDAVKQAGLTIFGEVDHSANAATVDLTLRPTTVLLIGNPRAGTPLMQINQSVGLDLPMRAVVWQDNQDIVWITYNDPRWIAERHNVLKAEADAIWSAMSAGLKKLSAAATT